MVVRITNEKIIMVLAIWQVIKQDVLKIAVVSWFLYLALNIIFY